ncbi:GxxExxY protein [Nostoc spongiaeforme FACHB-130]|uniref:GxxExxY protein n=1 Tax=Nostoc spongiaeforme FACHB-130 TaxID=1357510 RepID=A0ABR8FNT8_9NOSO|nr:GxxExxY protein [Nostoc spongiaeforme]MBD2593077.1 GxxExxY protein [Nostoc spongiaeforme FACHB-130]
MKADGRRWELNEITEKIIGSAFTVGKGLGCGFLEKVYENALAHELRKAELLVEQQYAIEVRYDGVVVGQFFADIVVEKCVLVELKAVRTIDENHFAQCLNYLKATGLTVCLLINFGNSRVEFKRVVRNF